MAAKPKWSKWDERHEQGVIDGQTYVIVTHVRTRDTGDGSPNDRQSHTAQAPLPGPLDAEGNPKQTVKEIIAGLHAKVREMRET